MTEQSGASSSSGSSLARIAFQYFGASSLKVSVSRPVRQEPEDFVAVLMRIDGVQPAGSMIEKMAAALTN